MIGVPLAMSPSQTSALNSLPHSMNADGSTMMNTLQQVLGAVATAVATSLLGMGQAASAEGGAVEPVEGLRGGDQSEVLRGQAGGLGGPGLDGDVGQPGQRLPGGGAHVVVGLHGGDAGGIGRQLPGEESGPRADVGDGVGQISALRQRLQQRRGIARPRGGVDGALPGEALFVHRHPSLCIISQIGGGSK